MSMFIGNGQNTDKLVMGIADSIYSEALDENRGVWVGLPYNINNTIASRKKYPVLYLLDGSKHMWTVAGVLSKRSSFFPKMIVVGIQNANQLRDLSPTVTDKLPEFFPKDAITGGGENFTIFLENELIPFIDDKYPTSPYRTLIGSSLGSLLVINTLLNYPHIFNSYIAMDPSLSYDDQNLLKKSDTILKDADFTGRSLYLGIAQTWDPRLDTAKVQYDTLRDEWFENPNGWFNRIPLIHPRSILHFAKEAENNKQNGLNFKWKYYPDELHGSVGFITAFDGLDFIFNWYKRDLLENLKLSIYNGEVDPCVLHNHFNRVGRGITSPPSHTTQHTLVLGGFKLIVKQFMV